MENLRTIETHPTVANFMKNQISLCKGLEGQDEVDRITQPSQEGGESVQN